MDLNNKTNKTSKITSKSLDITKWYTELIFYAKLAKYGPVKGTIYICPNAYFIWEQIQKCANLIFDNLKINNVYFPLLIPASYIQKEKNHVQGFKPELAIINTIGDKKLNEEIVIRPTSETLFCSYFKDEIKSYKDLPLKLNQWCNIIRWEKNTRPFLRNSEFLWQEGHGAFADEKQTMNFTLEIINKFKNFFEQKLSLYTIFGEKTNLEKFAGAEKTYTLEIILPNGYSLQIMTSHYLGNNFAKSFDIKFLDQNNKQKMIHQNSFGCSTRLIAALIMVHGDDYGLVLPPDISKFQINILTLFNKNLNNLNIIHQAEKIAKIFSSKYSVNIDSSEKNLGYKCIQSEMQGIPVYIEVGQNDLNDQSFNVYFRDTRIKQKILFNNLEKYVNNYLDSLSQKLLNNSKKMILDKIIIAKTKEEIIKIINQEKVALAPFSLDDNLELELKNNYAISIRCIEINKDIKNENCALNPQKKAIKWVYFAKAY